MKKWFIEYGIPNMCMQTDTIDAMDEHEATMHAYHEALEIYDSYAGMHGIMSVDEFMEEEGMDEYEANDAYHDSRENEIEYSAEEYDPEKHDDLL